MNLIRQGDIILKRIDKLPQNLVLKDNILAFGEATGHHHRFESNQVAVFKNFEGKQFVDVKKKSVLVHEEHAHLSIPKG